MKQRARNQEDKQERRAAILAVAGEVWEATTYAGFTMADVAERAGLAKGTLYLYFKTKEELLLALLGELFTEWFDHVDARLDGAGGRFSPARMARLFCESLEARPAFTRLIVILHAILEQNIEFEIALAFKTMLLDRLGRTSARVERRLPLLRGGDGARLLLHLHALVIGLRQMADPAPVARRVIEERRMEVFQIDFGSELTVALVSLIEGMERAGSRSGR
jgi:AcrR family transcriptional regulator